MKNLLLLILFSIINFFSWNYCGILFLLNIIILFYFIDYLKLKKWYYTYLIGITLFLLFNISVTFWLVKVDSYYSIYVFVVNSFLMFFPFALTVFFSNRTRHYPLIFIFSWVFWEWILSKWDLAWPWLNFGNVLSNQWYLVKWYSILGTYAGSLWLLIVGFLLYSILLKRKIKQNSIYLLFFLIFPIYSLFNYSLSNDLVCNKNIEILTYSPAFQFKKSETNYLKTKKLYKYICSHKTPNFILTSELFYTELYPNQLRNGDVSFFYKKIFETKPKSIFFIGTEIDNSELIKFNGISVISKDTILFRTKKKYVPITEYTPKLLRPLFGESYYSKNSIDGTNKIIDNHKIFPFVCYESLFPPFFAKNTINTKVIFLSTSEAFLKKSDYGKSQYLNMIRLRAIESGRYLVKCSNDGISCVIDPNGKIIQYLNREFETVTVPETTTNTIYQKITSYL